MPRLFSFASLLVLTALGCGQAMPAAAGDLITGPRQRITQLFANAGKRAKLKPPGKPVNQKALLKAVKLAAASTTAQLRTELMKLIVEQVGQKGLAFIPTNADREALRAAGATDELLAWLAEKMQQHSTTLEQQAWQACRTSAELHDFLQQYPESRYVTTAHQRLAQLAWEAIQDSERAADLQQFMVAHPAHEQLEAARARLALLAWQTAQTSGQSSAFADFLQTYPDSQFAMAARQRLMQSAWDNLKNSHDAARFTEFLERFPTGPLAEAARVRLEQLQWEAALAGSDQTKNYETYLQQYPNGHFAATARLRLERLANPSKFTNHTTEEAALKLEEAELRRYVINEVQPQTISARKKFVTVLVTLTPLGTVQAVEAIGGSSSLAKAALAAVQQWQFRSVQHEGKPVAAEGVLTIRFAEAVKKAAMP